MNIAAGVWRQTLDRATDLRRRAFAPPSPALDSMQSQPSQTALVALAQQLFFSSVRRTQILFAAADSATPIMKLCERVGRVVTEISRASVLIVDGNSVAAPDRTSTGLRPFGSLSSERNSAVQPAGNLWHIPNQAEPNCTMDSEGDAFDFVIVGANISDPTLISVHERCDGAVLIVTANHTRREAALRARDLLLSWNLELLGAVLDNRTFPVPDSIYRRL